MYLSVGGVVNGGRYACVRVASIREISVPSFQFWYEPKIALKDKVYKEKNIYTPSTH